MVEQKFPYPTLRSQEEESGGEGLWPQERDLAAPCLIRAPHLESDIVASGASPLLSDLPALSDPPIALRPQTDPFSQDAPGRM